MRLYVVRRGHRAVLGEIARELGRVGGVLERGAGRRGAGDEQDGRGQSGCDAGHGAVLQFENMRSRQRRGSIGRFKLASGAGAIVNEADSLAKKDFIAVALLDGSGADGGAGEVPEVEEEGPRHHRVEINDADAFARRVVEHHVVELAVIVRHALR